MDAECDRCLGRVDDLASRLERTDIQAGEGFPDGTGPQRPIHALPVPEFPVDGDADPKAGSPCHGS
jgi:hypothetical protein